MTRLTPISEFGLETVTQACARKGWAAKTVQNWINAGLLPAVGPVGGGRGGGSYLLRSADVDGFTPPPRGRPKSTPKPVARTRRKAR